MNLRDLKILLANFLGASDGYNSYEVNMVLDGGEDMQKITVVVDSDKKRLIILPSGGSTITYQSAATREKLQQQQQGPTISQIKDEEIDVMLKRVDAAYEKQQEEKRQAKNKKK